MWGRGGLECVCCVFLLKKSGYISNGLKFSGYLSDDESSRRTGPADMSVFRNAVQDCLDYEPVHVHKAAKLKGSKASNEAEVEKFSGLRIRSVILLLEELRHSE